MSIHFNSYFFIEFLITLDKKIFEWGMIYLNPEWLVKISVEVSKVKYIVVVLSPFLIVYILKKPGDFFYFLASILILAVISELMVSFLKAGIGRLRPGVITGLYLKPDAYSLPSAHAWNSMGLFTFLGLWFGKRIYLYILIAISFLVGSARFFDNNHFLLDVILGWFGGFILGWVYFRVCRRLYLLLR